jgi:hypothetical protein
VGTVLLHSAVVLSCSTPFRWWIGRSLASKVRPSRRSTSVSWAGSMRGSACGDAVQVVGRRQWRFAVSWGASRTGVGGPGGGPAAQRAVLPDVGYAVVGVVQVRRSRGSVREERISIQYPQLLQLGNTRPASSTGQMPSATARTASQGVGLV